MLVFFHKYQRFFLILVTVVIIGSFSFFGAFSTFSQGGDKRADRVLTQAVDGSSLTLLQVQNLSRFLASDREETYQTPNLCNDGVIRYDLLQTGLADLLVAAYFDPLQDDLSQRLERAGRYRPYEHPSNPLLSAKAVWDRFLPTMTEEWEALQQSTQATPATFTHLSRLYRQQQLCPSELLRRFLLYQQAQMQMPQDPRLQYDDLALFGFHSMQDWFGKNFIDLVAEFILNTARVAEQKGYTVSREEAKGDLLRNFQASMQKLDKPKRPADFTFAQQLRLVGLDEKSAIECWQNVLLFRRYFHGVGESTFVDRLPYRDFAAYARETAVVQLYRWPEALHLKTLSDFFAFEAYLDAVGQERDRYRLPTVYFPLAEIEKRAPELVQATYQVSLVERTLGEIGLRASVQEVSAWEEDNWSQLKSHFRALALPDAATKEERSAALVKLGPQARSMVDQFAREQLATLHPEWIADSLSQAPPSEQTVTVSKNWVSLPKVERPAELADLLEKGDVVNQYFADAKTVLRIVAVTQKEPKHLLTWEEAQHAGLLSRLLDRLREKGETQEEAGKRHFASRLKEVGGKPFRRLEAVSAEGRAAVQKNPEDPRWCKQGIDLLSDQFKFERKPLEIQRTTNEDWMAKEVFSMASEQWSPLWVPEDGGIAFFYFEQKKLHPDPILDQMTMGKEIVAADAQRYAAQTLLQVIRHKHSIVIPIQEEKE